jgi:hypothetical protein
MKTTFLVSVFLLIGMTACSDSGDQVDCRAAIEEKMQADLKAEEDALDYRLTHETLTSVQKSALISTSSARKETIRKAAAANAARCD